MTHLLEIRDLRISVGAGRRRGVAVRGLGLHLDRGERLGIVGESGSGKTLTALATMGLVDQTSVSVDRGAILFEGIDLLGLDPEGLRRIRGREIAMIFQDPLTALNPIMAIGDQIGEAVRAHRALSRRTARDEAVRLLDLVGIGNAAERYRFYPHQFSGGMRQRVMIAIALACRPKLLIADEPTTALDVTTQAQIMGLLDSLQHETGVAILLISHNLALVGSFCSRIAIMYAGDIVEQGPARDVLLQPRHPYTRGLLSCLPQEIDMDRSAGPLVEIPGQVPAVDAMVSGCRFSGRCPRAVPGCSTVPPPTQSDDAESVQWRCIY